MKTALALTCLVISSALTPIAAYSSDDVDMDRSHPKAFVKDSAITAKIKTQLAAQHLSSLTRIHVDTDADGVVWLSGVASSQADIEKAKTIARNTEHVVAVKSDIKLTTD
jgi:hyperosmotically inducible periplasmic protein